MNWLLCGCLLIPCLAAIWFCGYAMLGARDLFSGGQETKEPFEPPVSVLKPLCGLDIGMYENLASFCRQDYPCYQIVFGVRDPDDPSVGVVRRLMRDFPQTDIRLVINSRMVEGSPKVGNLVNIEAEAKYPTMVVSDSDIRVGRDYLRRVIRPLKDPRVGAVTCMYRSLGKGVLPTIEALRISTDFVPGLLVARKLEGVKFALGSTVAVRREAFDAIGGFPAIAHYLADDFMLGNLIYKAGYRVVLSDCVVEHALTTRSVSEMIQRDVRWNRGMRVSRPWGYLGLVFTQGIPFSLIFFLLRTRSVLGWAVLGATWGIRLWMGRVVGFFYLKDRAARKRFWMAPFVDLLAFGTWCYGFLGNGIEWRGQRFKLTKMGKLVPVPAGPATVFGRPSRRLAPLAPALSAALAALFLIGQNPPPHTTPVKPNGVGQAQVTSIRLSVSEIPPPPVLHERVSAPARKSPVLKRLWGSVDLLAGFSGFGTLALKDGLLDRDESRPIRNRAVFRAGRSALLMVWGVGMFKQMQPAARAFSANFSQASPSWHLGVEPFLDRDERLSARVICLHRF